MRTLVHHFRNDSNPLFATGDGSVVGANGTFGWVLSLSDGTRLVSCKGVAIGHPMTSYRAEAFGTWSLLLFLKSVLDHFRCHLQEKPQIHCDNQGLVDNVNHILKRIRDAFPNDTLISDWDILNEILALLATIPSSYRWIKGHQDDHKPKAQLPLPAQLNIEADELADEAHQIQPPASSRLWRAPHNPIQILHNCVPITSKLKNTLRKLLTGPDLIDHIRSKTGWSDETFDSVDWDSHKRAITTTQIPDMFVTKFIHNALPTGDRVHQYKKHYDHRCPSCGYEHEDRTHLLLCRAPDRRSWVGHMLTELREYCLKTYTSLDMTQLLSDGLHCYFHDTALENPRQYPDRLQELIRSQETIGWDQLVFGRLSLLWTSKHLAQLTSRNISPTPFNSGAQWASTIINIIWKHVHKLWLHRNEIRHGKDKAEQLEKQKQLRLSELYLYYTYRDEHFLNMDNIPDDIFYATYQEHIHHESSNTALDTWLCTYRDIITNNKLKIPTHYDHTHSHIFTNGQSRMSNINADGVT